MGMRRSVLLGIVAVGALSLTACVGGGPSPGDVAAEFATPIEPEWTTEVPGMFGEPVIRDGVVLAYADDEEVGMRLTAVDLASGDILWEHTASPGGAYGNPILTSVFAASRPYPLPTITPTVIERGDDDDPGLAVVFTERDIEMQSIRPDDLLRVVDLHTGEELEVTVPDFDPDDFLNYDPIGIQDEDGDVFANFYTPARQCGELVCWAAEDPETTSGYSLVTLDPATLELRIEKGFLPGSEDPLGPDYGMEYLSIATDDDFDLARYVDGAEVWRHPTDELFGVERTSLPDFGGVAEFGDLVLVQGYQAMRETLDQVHTYDLDFVTSRTLVAVDRDSGDVVWRVEGGDMLCHAVHERLAPADSESIPICLATGGSFLYDLVTEDFAEQVDLEASIVELDVATGELGWESEHSGEVSLAQVGNLLDVTYSSRGDLALVDRDEETGLVDLRDGSWYPLPEEGEVVRACKAERDDVELDFEGSAFASGQNPITTGYPAGWRHYPCDEDGAEIDGWSKGAVRVAGYRDAESPELAVIVEEGALVGFRL